MKKLLIFTAVFCLHQADAQVARHFWLNDSSYNHTLSPTSDYGYILAAARAELNLGVRNTIAVFKLDRFYNIVNSRIIGLPSGTGFDGSVNFEVHDVIENRQSPNTVFYVICGSINKPGITANAGMVAIVDTRLNVLDIREYPDVEVFYSVYSVGSEFYVCGKTIQREGIVLQDNLFGRNPTAYITTQLWEYHKVITNNNGNDLVASGSGGNECGFTAFSIAGGILIPIVNLAGQFASQKLQHSPNAKTVVANYPGNPRGLLLSMSFSGKIYTYLYSDYTSLPSNPPIVNGFLVGGPTSSDPLLLEDMDLDVNSSPVKIAWVGNRTTANQFTLTAFYISVELPLPLSTPPTPPVANLVSIYYPTPTPFTEYFRLHKVYFNSNDHEFHCGGFYNNTNNNKTTFVLAPEQAILNRCGTMLPLGFDHYNMGYFPLLITPMNRINVQSNQRLDIIYNFCDEDCDNTQLNDPSNSNCGN